MVMVVVAFVVAVELLLTVVVFAVSADANFLVFKIQRHTVDSNL